jgi:hypothetical protein
MAKQRSTNLSQLTPQEERHHTQWGAQLLVAAELERRGCTVSFTMGHNTPIADLMVASRNGVQFAVDVKGQASKSSWNLREKNTWPNLFYILVYFPPKTSNVGLIDRFFILTQAEANQLVTKYRQSHPGDSGKAPGFGFSDPILFENQWDKLP